jgi:hypothetical protein
MKQLIAIQHIDFLRIQNWFRSHSGTKLLILLAFFLIIAFIVAIEFILANVFFRFLSTQKEFGKAVAEYSINAALLVIFLLAVVSSFASSSSSLYKPDFLRFLHSLPISQGKLLISRLITSLASSLWMIMFFLSPLILAFGLNFQAGPQFVLRGLTVLFLLIASSHAVGTSISVLIVNHIGRVSRKTMAFVFILFISSSILLMRFLFPPSFFRLYHAADWPAFQRQLGQLPLLSTFLPTNWLASTLTSGWSLASLVAIGLVMGIVGISLWIGEVYYLSSWRRAQEGQFLAGAKLTKIRKRSNFPVLLNSPLGSLIANDLLAVARSSRELGYLAFLAGLTFALLYLTRNIPALAQAQPEFLPTVQTMSLIGFSYLFMTLTARLVYPLIAREKRTSWLLFSQPLSRLQVLEAKVIFAFLVAFPALPISYIASRLAMLPPDASLTYTLILFVTAISLSLIQLFAGTIAPNFKESDNLEATSTSGSGLAAIILCLIFSSISGAIFYQFITFSISFLYVFLSMMIVSVIMLTPLWILARKSIYNYDI